MIRRFIFFLIILIPLLFSCKSAKLSDAIDREERGEYYEAAQIYRRVYSKTSPKKTIQRGVIAYHMAYCFQKVNQATRALGGYTNAIRYEYPDSSSFLYQAQMSHRLGKYADAIKQYEHYLETFPDDVLAKNGLFGCRLAQEWKNNPSRYVVKKMDKWSSREGEYAPMLLGPDYDQLYFSSGRKNAIGEEKSLITGTKNADFFLIKQNEKGQWQSPETIEDGINTEFDEGVGSFSVDGSQLYYTYCSEDLDFPRTAEIRVSSRSGAAWGAGTKLDIYQDTTTMAAHPAIGSDGYLYFVSDVIGGYGGKDIWRIPLAAVGMGLPENLGPDINTPGDEMFPYMRSDTVLYFSSDGLPGMGGVDIFKAKQDKDGKWRPENMKVPINSAGDDFGITFAGMQERGYFSSNRNDSRGADHIYSFELPGIYVYVEGWVLNKEDEEMEGAKVRIAGKEGTYQQIFARADGTYFMEVIPGMDYVMMASAPGYLNQRQALSVPSGEKSETYYVDFYLNSISKPEVIDNIYYEFDKANLLPESKEALDELVLLMEDNPHITIELSSHADRKGSETYNINLSQWRAQSVIDYLIDAGIATDRLTAMGYGKNKPYVVTKKLAIGYEFLPEGQELTPEFIETLSPEQQEIADQINRRTEFEVLSTDYGLF
jgi:Outer membrane protein and related peptidoglycan-associated (lipo)proteins